MNDRFPHTCKVLRSQVDENNLPMTDDEGNEFPKLEIMTSKCGYRQNSKSTKEGVVIEADYLLALPRHLIDIHTGDEIEVTDYVRTYQGTVIKPFTGNFGSNIWFNESKGQ